MLLDTTLKTIEVVLGAAKTTNDCEVNCTVVDTVSGTTFSPVGLPNLTNGTSVVTIVTSPAASTQRHVKSITVYNADTVNQTVTIRSYDGTNRRRHVAVALAPGQSLIYTAEAGWQILTVSPGQIIGTATNDNAAVGCVGEIISANLDRNSALTPNTATATNVANISLTPGDWDIRGMVACNFSGLSTQLNAGIQTISATNPAAYPALGAASLVAWASSLSVEHTSNCQLRVSLAATTTYYIVGVATFSTGASSMYGYISARRRR